MNDISQPSDECNAPKHVAIIMDGNGRWANKRGLARFKGHKTGVETVKRIVKTARSQGVEYLTLYSFSTENWSRPTQEVTELMGLLKVFIRKDLAELHQNNVRLKVIGDMQNLPKDIGPMLEDAQLLTKDNTAQTLVIAFNYGSQDEISRAVKTIAAKVEAGDLSASDICQETITQHLDTKDIPQPDLIIRTGGEKRLSNFLLWQAAYSELVFVETMWPDFCDQEFIGAIEEFKQRTRRYGGLKSIAKSAMKAFKKKDAAGGEVS